MRRVRRVLEASKGRDAGLIDLHCGNNLLGTQYGRVSPALQFMHLMPYLDSLWFGEGYDYNEEPAYWLVEVSGLPFGLMGDMMHQGHAWRGMVYGMTTRFRCADPQPLWQLWDDFGIANATMHLDLHAPPAPPISSLANYFDAKYLDPTPTPRRPSHATSRAAPLVRVAGDDPGCGAVRVSAYVRRGQRCLLAVASWCERDLACELEVDWSRLGLAPASATMETPHLPALGQIGVLAAPVPWAHAQRHTVRLEVAAAAGGLYVLAAPGWQLRRREADSLVEMEPL